MSEKGPKHRRPHYLLNRSLHEQNGVASHVVDHWLDGYKDRYNVHQRKFIKPTPYIYESRVGTYIHDKKFVPYLMSLNYELHNNHTYTRVRSQGDRLLVDGGTVHRIRKGIETVPQFKAEISTKEGFLERALLLTDEYRIGIRRNRRTGSFEIEKSSDYSDNSIRHDFDPRNLGMRQREEILRYYPTVYAFVHDINLTDQDYRFQLPIVYNFEILESVRSILALKNSWEYPAEASTLGGLGIYFDALTS